MKTRMVKLWDEEKEGSGSMVRGIGGVQIGLAWRIVISKRGNTLKKTVDVGAACWGILCG